MGRVIHTHSIGVGYTYPFLYLYHPSVFCKRDREINVTTEAVMHRSAHAAEWWQEGQLFAINFSLSENFLVGK